MAKQSYLRWAKCSATIADVLTSIMGDHMEENKPKPTKELYKTLLKSSHFRDKLSSDAHHQLQNLEVDGFKKLDINLMYKIARYFKSFYDPPTRDWNADPLPNEIEVGDDMERIRKARNFYAHRLSVTEEQMEEFFRVFTKVAERFDRRLKKTGKDSYAYRIRSYKQTAIGNFEGNTFEVEIGPGKVLHVIIGESVSNEIGNTCDGDELCYRMKIFGIENETTVADKINERKDQINEQSKLIKLKGATVGSLIFHLLLYGKLFSNEHLLFQELKSFIQVLLSNLKFPDSVALYAVITFENDEENTDDIDEEYTDEIYSSEEDEENRGLNLDITVPPHVFESTDNSIHHFGNFVKAVSTNINGHKVNWDEHVTAVLESGNGEPHTGFERPLDQADITQGAALERIIQIRDELTDKTDPKFFLNNASEAFKRIGNPEILRMWSNLETALSNELSPKGKDPVSQQSEEVKMSLSDSERDFKQPNNTPQVEFHKFEPEQKIRKQKGASIGDDKLDSDNYEIVVAIDFGTTYSGYAYCLHSDYKKNNADPTVHFNRWNTGTSITPKAPTCVLFNPNQEIVKFGYDAMNYYHDNPDNQDFSNWYYFEHFKMMLFDEKDKLTKNTVMQESIGLNANTRKKKMKALDVFASVIKYFKEDLLDIRGSGILCSLDRIKWVLTVPAIWDLKAKTFMRDAAVKAGIPSKHLILALEPEAASIHCRRVPVGLKSEGDGRRIIAGLTSGSRYIVIDQGGGTTDIAVHEVMEQNTLKEIYPACGGHWGGITVNSEFTDFLDDLFGSEVIKTVKGKNSSAYFRLQRNFENAKTEYTEDHAISSEGLSTIILPVEWIDVYEEVNKESLQEAVKRTKFKENVVVKGGKLRLKNSLFRTFFNYAIHNITKELEKIILKEDLADVKTLLIVGGHSESSVLTTAIKKSFPNLSIIVPKNPSLAVLKGAVLFGFEPEIVTSRVMQYTYGIAMQRHFIPGVDDEIIKHCLVNGLVDNVFDKHIERGQIVKVGEFQEEHEYIPVTTDQIGVHYEFYATLDKNPKYVTDEGCKCIGILYFALTKGMSNNKKMLLKINASGTEIEAVVTEKATGKQSEGYFCLLD